MDLEILHLHLSSPIDVPGEELYYYPLNETQGLSFEPQAEFLFASPITEKREEDRCGCLPQGLYLFAQKREALDWDSIIEMAVELQLEGLWQRLKLQGGLYLRLLYEDGSMVTQVFRPYEA